MHNLSGKSAYPITHGLDINTDPSTPSDWPIASVVGRFTGDDHPDIVALGAREACDVSKCEARLWLLPSTGAARLSVTPPSAMLPPEIHLVSTSPGDKGPALLVFPIAADLDGDGFDELVLLSSLNDSGTGAWLARPDRTGLGWVNPSVPVSLVGSTSLSVVMDSNPRVADLDGDGRQDLVLILAAPGGGRVVAIAWNDGDGKVSLDHPWLLSLDKEEPVAVGLLAADTDQIADLVVASASGVFLARAGTDSKRALQLTRVAQVSGARSVAGGDITGDGVDDLVVAVEGGLRVFRGEAAEP